jgi:hypothetical protein
LRATKRHRITIAAPLHQGQSFKRAREREKQKQNKTEQNRTEQKIAMNLRSYAEETRSVVTSEEKAAIALYQNLHSEKQRGKKEKRQREI